MWSYRSEEGRAVVHTEPAQPPTDWAMGTPGAGRGPGTLAAATAQPSTPRSRLWRHEMFSLSPGRTT
ncbi:hypothetical protein HEK616_35780 [Streptomyces nigrescens]|uniref:Uncharacterized protein n=1 Tax=Streptomyces nigrescens TaxID=1920 RepID=A0ABM7ZUW0_STRNI|nr:hypothetical protein HEK616_35780 [Streptomyces nigrescens]